MPGLSVLRGFDSQNQIAAAAVSRGVRSPDRNSDTFSRAPVQCQLRDIVCLFFFFTVVPFQCSSHHASPAPGTILFYLYGIEEPYGFL